MGASAAFGLPPALVAEALRNACITDVTAFKPGNVSLASPGHGMHAEDFVTSAQAVAEVIVTPGLRVGERILRAVEATREVVAFNTNLGIVLLCAPLVHAVVELAAEPALPGRLRAVLSELDGPDRIYRRARVRLEKLDHELRAWNDAAKGAHDDVLQSLHARMQEICVKIPDADAARASCEAFLKSSA